MPPRLARRATSRLAAATLAAALLPAAAAAQFGTNLIVNPGGEAQVPNADLNGPDAITGWTTTGTFELSRYGPNGVDNPIATSPGPADRGLNFFVGGNGPSPATTSTATQLLSLAGFGGLDALVDAGAVTYNLSAFLGGSGNQNDNMSFTAAFLNGAATTIGSVTLGPVFAADRGNVTGLLLRSAAAALPVGTRAVRFTMTAVLTNPTYNNASADNLSFTLSTGAQAVVPEPGTWALLGTGLLGVAGIARRRARSLA